jgi:stalled ribosome alternative rescue factor ArfA
MKKELKRRSPVASSLRERRFDQQIEPAQKGRRAYKRAQKSVWKTHLEDLSDEPELELPF